MDLAKLDNWQRAEKQLEKTFGDNYEILEDGLKFSDITKLLKTMDEWVDKKMKLLKAAKGRMMTSKEQQDLQVANDRIFGYIQILGDKGHKIESTIKKLKFPEEVTKKMIDDAAELIHEEIADYASDYKAINKYDDRVFTATDLKTTQDKIDRIVKLGFAKGQLEKKIDDALELADQVESSYKNWVQSINSSQEGGRRRGAIVIPDLIKEFNTAFPNNSHGMRSVTTHLKYFRDIFDLLRKGDLANKDGFAQITLPMIDTFDELVNQTKMASRFIDLLNKYATGPGALKPSTVGLFDPEIGPMIKDHLDMIRKLLAGLKSKMADVL